MNVSHWADYSRLILILQQLYSQFHPRSIIVSWERSTQHLAFDIRDQLRTDPLTVWTLVNINRLPQPTHEFINFFKVPDAEAKRRIDVMVISVVGTYGLTVLNEYNFFFREDKKHCIVYRNEMEFPLDLLRNTFFNGIIVHSVGDSIRYLVWPEGLWSSENKYDFRSWNSQQDLGPSVDNDFRNIRLSHLNVISQLAPPSVFNVTDTSRSKWGVLGSGVFMSRIIAKEFRSQPDMVLVDFKVPSQNIELVQWYEAVTKDAIVLNTYDLFMKGQQTRTMSSYSLPNDHPTNVTYSLYLRSEFANKETTKLYPHEQDSYIVLVPNYPRALFSFDQFLNRIIILNSWTAMLLLLSVFRLTSRYVSKNEWGTLVEVFFDSYARSLAISVRSKPMALSESIIVLFLSIYSLLTGISVAGQFFQAIFTQKPDQMYSSLADINASALPIMCPIDFDIKEFTSWSSVNLNSKIVFAETHLILEKIWQVNTKFAYVLPKSYSESLIIKPKSREHAFTILGPAFVSYPVSVAVSHWYMADWANRVVQRCIENGLWYWFEDISNHTRKLALTQMELLNKNNISHHIRPDHRGMANDYAFAGSLFLMSTAQSLVVFLIELLVDYLARNKIKFI